MIHEGKSTFVSLTRPCHRIKKQQVAPLQVMDILVLIEPAHFRGSFYPFRVYTTGTYIIGAFQISLANQNPCMKHTLLLALSLLDAHDR